MYIYFEILSGAEMGQYFRVRPNNRFGSGDCEIKLSDPTLPALHSQILLDNKSRLVLVCTNAVFEISADGKIMKKVILEDGLNLKIANSSLKVHILDKPINDAHDPLRPMANLENNLQNLLNPTEDLLSRTFKVQRESPNKSLIDGLQTLLESAQNPNSPASFRLFCRPVVLRIEKGAQAEDEFIVSWGPRDFGPLVLEFPIEFPPFPRVLFTLTPNANGDIVFSTKHSDFARVSGQSDSTCVMKSGDRIIAGNSTILVEFLGDSSRHEKN